MKRFEQTFPVILLVCAIIAIGIGMESSPARIPLSTTVIDGGGELLPPEVYYMDEGENIEELIAADRHRNNFVSQTRVYIPYKEANKKFDAPYTLSQIAR